MPLEIRNTFFSIDGSKSSFTCASPVIVNGMILRVFNSGSTTQTYTYTDTSLAETTVSVLASGSAGNPLYVLIASGSIVGVNEFVPGLVYTDAYFNNSTKILSKTLLITGSELGGTFTEQFITTVGSGSWTKPEGVTQVIVECMSGGGGGGGATISPSGGGGGGGGQYAKKLLIYPSAQQSIPYVVGGGGVGSTGNGTSGSNTTWDVNKVVTIGGAGGLGSQIGELDPRGGGVAANESQAVGDIIVIGNNGEGGYYDPVGAAGAAGSFGGSGGRSPGAIGQAGGIPPFELGDFGGESVFASTGGINGLPGDLTSVTAGAGGGGAARWSGGINRSGGNGARGLIRLIYR